MCSCVVLHIYMFGCLYCFFIWFILKAHYNRLKTIWCSFYYDMKLILFISKNYCLQSPNCQYSNSNGHYMWYHYQLTSSCHASLNCIQYSISYILLYIYKKIPPRLNKRKPTECVIFISDGMRSKRADHHNECRSTCNDPKRIASNQSNGQQSINIRFET